MTVKSKITTTSHVMLRLCYSFSKNNSLVFTWSVWIFSSCRWAGWGHIEVTKWWSWRQFWLQKAVLRWEVPGLTKLTLKRHVNQFWVCSFYLCWEARGKPGITSHVICCLQSWQQLGHESLDLLGTSCNRTSNFRQPDPQTKLIIELLRYKL